MLRWQTRILELRHLSCVVIDLQESGPMAASPILSPILSPTLIDELSLMQRLGIIPGARSWIAQGPP